MKVHIHGNCQAYVLGGMLGEVFPHWDITWSEVHTDEIVTRNEDYRRQVASADLVLSQPIHRGFREREDLSLDWVRGAVRDDAMLLVFPSMHFTGHHPSGADLDLPGDPDGDAIAASLVAGGLDPDTVGAILTAPDLMGEDLIRNELALSIAEMARREVEDQIDIKLSPLLEAAAGRAQLFHIVNHPARLVYVSILNEILARLGFRRRAEEDGRDWQDIPHLPPLPSVGAYLARPGGAAGEAAVLLPGREPATQRDYYRGLAAQLAAFPPDVLLDAVHRRVWARGFLDRFAAAVTAGPSPAAEALAPGERIAAAQNLAAELARLVRSDIRGRPFTINPIASPQITIAEVPTVGLTFGRDETQKMQHDAVPISGSHRDSGVRDMVYSEIPDAAESLSQIPGVEEAVRAARAAEAGGNLAQALEAWAIVRARFPQEPSGFSGPGAALRLAGLNGEAEAILASGRERFPDDLSIAAEFAWVARSRNDLDVAVDRWNFVRERFPDQAMGYLWAAVALRDLRRYDEAERLLLDAVVRFPDSPDLAADYALVANLRQDWAEASRRWVHFRERFPDHPAGYTGAAWAFRGQGMYDLADVILAEAEKRFPDLPDIVRDRAVVAHDRGDWEEAARRWAVVRSAVPTDLGGLLLGAKALLALQRYEEAEDLLITGCKCFPDDAQFHVELAESAALRGDQRESMRRWMAARRRFPLDRLVQERLFQARMRLAEADPDMLDRDGEAELATPEDQHMHDIMMSFESLGGARFGCEFGGVQRAFGAEPLGLLRWADLAPENVISALERRFDGIGLPDNTEIFTYGEGEYAEYGTRDRHFDMVMHTFVLERSAPANKVLQASCRRLQYLRRKLIEDLESAAKIFVYKLTYDHLTESQLNRLHAAVRAYGPSSLLYVRYSDAEHPDGSVQVVAPGLLVGYLDHFGTSREDKPLPVPVDSWAAVCKAAYELWRSGAAEYAANSSPSTNTVTNPLSDIDVVPRVRLSDDFIARLRNEMTQPAASDLQRRLGNILADSVSANRGDLRDRLNQIAEDYSGQSFRDSWFFENFVVACIFAGAFDLACRAIGQRFEATWRCDIALERSDGPVPIVRWEAEDKEHSRFVFSPDLFGDDHVFDIILFWARTLALYDAYHRSRDFSRGVVNVSLWDVGLAPGISFSDNDSSHLLAPDPMFLSLEGYRQLRSELDQARVPWEQRIPRLLWRGATTGAWDHRDLGSLPRFRLCQVAAKSGDLIDAGISSIVQMDAEEESWVRKSGLMRAGVKPQDFARHKYQIDIDGNTNSWAGLFHKLYSGSPVLKVESAAGYRQWYYDRMIPWYNYVPVSKDMSDLLAKINWLRANDDSARKIGERGQELATALDYRGELTKAAPTVAAAMCQQAFLSARHGTSGGVL